ncbi:MAG: c-type cytochrome [Pirellulaceae bacterium]|nr:c-type cytochrome [Pirellulaceae bacterium]
MKPCLRCLMFTLIAVAVLAVVIVTSGIVPATASSGHLPITEWMLAFAMKRSVSTHSLGITAPDDLDNAALVKRGAAHFDVGCYWCHGGPGSEPSRIVLNMTPHPPDLSDEIAQWTPAELAYIVGHGVKFTGMPAWPEAHRRDEVWAVVAFLKEYHRLDQSTYAELAGRGEVSAARQSRSAIPEVVTARCVACHGIDGEGRMAFPRLAGQSLKYLRASLIAYQTGQRYSGMMGSAAASLSEKEIEVAAQYYAAFATPDLQQAEALTTDAPAGTARIGTASAGAAIARQGLPSQKVGACVECHGPNSREQTDSYPQLAGQRADYLVQQLHLLREKKRGGTRYLSIMEEIADKLTDQQIQDVAAFYAR